MAVNSSRSETASLIEGATDGKYRKVRPNTDVAPATGGEIMAQNRSHLHPPYNYGYVNQELPIAQRAVPGR